MIASASLSSESSLPATSSCSASGCHFKFKFQSAAQAALPACQPECQRGPASECGCPGSTGIAGPGEPVTASLRRSLRLPVSGTGTQAVALCRGPGTGVLHRDRSTTASDRCYFLTSIFIISTPIHTGATNYAWHWHASLTRYRTVVLQ